MSPAGARGTHVPRPAPARYTLAYAGILLFTLTLYLRPNDLLPIGDVQIARLIAAATLGAYVLEGAAAGRFLAVFPKELKYLLGLTAMMVLSIPLALDPAEALDTLTGLFLKVVLVYVVLINAVTSVAQLRRLMAVTTLAGGALAVATLSNYLSGEYQWYRATSVVGGMLGNPNDLALALAVLAPIALGLALTSPTMLGRVLHGLSVAAMAPTVLATYSRAGLIALAAGGVYVAVKGLRLRARLTLVVLAGAALAVALVPQGYVLRILSIFDTALDTSGSVSARMDLVERAFQVVALNPKVWLVGVGLGNFHIVSIGETVSHNAFLDVLAEVGVPAFALYVAFLVGSFRAVTPLVRDASAGRVAPRLGLLALGIQASLVAYAVGSAFASVAYQWYVYYPAAYAVCLPRLARVRGDDVAPAAAGIAPPAAPSRRRLHVEELS